MINFSDLVNVFNKLNLNVEVVADEMFNQSLDDILKDESKQDGIFGITTILDDDRDLSDIFVPVDKKYTLQVLSELGFEWPETSEKYLYDFLKQLNDLEFFKI